ncbi:seminal vesicle secretory protein 5-like [Peromyscus leucopus]|uniref:seminal vesicle secretory protein 5-like n=1 Tax=Peromyscus leucopus TaxID=10041 RepID=UPI0010A1EB74|nr:seminal vesicle secretory protein 5-like [Peromyscus leucopus]XP_037060307.1 seminal vesicle secretory protein 5-like [Peromyscus leucopus]
MNPTGFFLLTLLLVLVTETASRKTREKFSQASDDNIDLKALGGSGGSSSSHEEYSSSEGSWSSFKSRSLEPTTFDLEAYDERKHKHTADNGNLGYKTRGSQREDMSSFKSRMKTRIAGK